jgi:hypothetical protein
VEISARYDALGRAAQQFARAFVDVADVQRTAVAALDLAHQAVGDPTASAAMAALSGRLSTALFDAGSRIIDVAGGLSAAVERYRSADQAASGAAVVLPERPGRPR